MSDASSPFLNAVNTLKLSPQEQYLYWHHLNNLFSDGKVVQPNGDVSTLLQAVVSGPGGRYYNIPTVWDGQVLTVPEARTRASQVGWSNFPGYATPEQADARYADMHKYLEQDVNQYEKTLR